MDDTIAAIATAVGEAGLSVVRVSGPQAMATVDRVFRRAAPGRLAEAPSHTVHYGWVLDPATGQPVDEVLATVMRAPRSYTREDVVELSGHGGVVAGRRILETVVAAGARLAEPGEFTKRAFLNGRLDLAQAEAVLQLIRATHEAAHTATVQQLRGGLSAVIRRARERLVTAQAHLEVGVDFPGEGHAVWSSPALDEALGAVEGEIAGLLTAAERARARIHGAVTVICGRPNVGKSSLLNALLRRERAIVSPRPGTTRDTVEETIVLHGMPVRFVDTAGLTESDDPLEQAGVARSREALAAADLALWVVDRSTPLTPQDAAVAALLAPRPCVVALNKVDLPSQLAMDAVRALAPASPVMPVAARDGQGIAELEAQIAARLAPPQPSEPRAPWVTHARHEAALREAHAAVRRARAALAGDQSPELVAVDVREALDQLGTITGETASDELLAAIFSQFCIGK
ncbi:MAG: tRNA uridine-5-carboxymethylaminomethyl(34) synthesis GTPase MnmE [Candidatus Omnitrophica bacterium]|nr:tRNA uridine-5-carboxymethylaminomethyl(34) synthesis GTPase MnmE [Candidatus Omnitrophota bacterium]